MLKSTLNIYDVTIQVSHGPDSDLQPVRAVSAQVRANILQHPRGVTFNNKGRIIVVEWKVDFFKGWGFDTITKYFFLGGGW